MRKYKNKFLSQDYGNNYYGLKESYDLIGKKIHKELWEGDEHKYREGRYLEPSQAAEILKKYKKEAIIEVRNIEVRNIELERELIEKVYKGKISLGGHPTALKEFSHLEEKIKNDAEYLKCYDKMKRHEESLETLQAFIADGWVQNVKKRDIGNKHLQAEELKPETFVGHQYDFEKDVIKSLHEYELWISKKQLDYVLETIQPYSEEEYKKHIINKSEKKLSEKYKIAWKILIIDILQNKDAIIHDYQSENLLLASQSYINSNLTYEVTYSNLLIDFRKNPLITITPAEGVENNSNSKATIGRTSLNSNVISPFLNKISNSKN